jgi:hypothetical protein
MKRKRFPAFNRALHKMLHPPRLHPAMRERMWKPGQSGNPTGMNMIEAARERREAAEQRRLNPSPGARRTRRWKERRKRGSIVAAVELGPEMTSGLVRLGWLPAANIGDKTAIAGALVRLAEASIKLGVARDLFDRAPDTGGN